MEVERDFYRPVEIEHFADNRGGVVGVAHPVDFAALNHDEEAFGVVQNFDCLLREFGYARAGGVVDCVGKRAVGGKRHDFAAAFFDAVESLFAPEDLVARLFGEFVGVAFFAARFALVGAADSAAAEEVEV